MFIAGNAYETDKNFPDLYFQASFIIAPNGNVVLRYRRLNSMYAVTPHDVWSKYLDIYGIEGVFPVADTAMDTPSYVENAKAKPLNAAMMKWFAGKTFVNKEDAADPRVALLKVKSFKGLPSATIIGAQIDPLRSEGEALAQRFNSDGVKVVYRNYEGVTHEFFGMAAVVDQAKAAQSLVASQLKAAFAGAPPAAGKK